MKRSFCGHRGGVFCDLPLRGGGCPDFIHQLEDKDRQTIITNLGHYRVLREEIVSRLNQDGIAASDENVFSAAVEQGMSETTSYIVAMI